MKELKENKIHLASLVMIFISFFLILWVGYKSNFPRQVWELKTGESGLVEVLGDEFTHGDSVPIILDYCKYHNIEGTFSAQFVDGVIYTTPSKSGNAPVGCDKIISHTVSIPHALPAGEYYLSLNYTHTPNPFRTITVSYKTGKFKVIED